MTRASCTTKRLDTSSESPTISVRLGYLLPSALSARASMTAYGSTVLSALDALPEPSEEATMRSAVEVRSGEAGALHLCEAIGLDEQDTVDTALICGGIKDGHYATS